MGPDNRDVWWYGVNAKLTNQLICFTDVHKYSPIRQSLGPFTVSRHLGGVDLPLQKFFSK